MSSRLPAEEGRPDVATPPPAHLLPGGAQHRLIETVVEPKIKELRDKVEGNHDTLLKGLAAGFLFLIAALAGGFLLLDQKIDGLNKDLGSRIENVNSDLGAKLDAVNASLGGKIDAVNGNLSIGINAANLSLVKVQTQLDDLMSRIPPVVTPVPHG